MSFFKLTLNVENTFKITIMKDFFSLKSVIRCLQIYCNFLKHKFSVIHLLFFKKTNLIKVNHVKLMLL